jgi:formate dehydrogenase beta subunit
MINWKSNVFPGILGAPATGPASRPAAAAVSRRSPVAICRLKRVAADNKDATSRSQACRKAPEKNGKRVACIGGGPASLTVARDLAPLGYEIVIYDQDPKLGGMIRSQIPRFRLPESVIDEEVGYITRHRQRRASANSGSIQPEGRAGRGLRRGLRRAPARRAAATSTCPAARKRPPTSISASTGCPAVSFGHITKIGKRVIVLGGGNTAMDCCRTARRLGGET